MTDKSILITGCSSGIGQACALGMKARGWRVFATARKASDINQLKKHGLEAFHLDYTDEASIGSCADEVLKLTGGGLDALFNNGAYGQPGAVEDLRTDVLRAQFEANFFGWHELTRRIIPAMRENGRGRIVQCSSCLGLVSLKYRGAYNASKFALEALTDALRQELADTGIEVVLIEPGPIATRFGQHALEAYRANIDLKNTPHAEVYAARIAAMEDNKPSRWRLGPDAVLRKLIHAVESPKPKPRYFVTVPTYMLEAGRRLLTTRRLDRMLAGE